jgi:hypothetical protein
MELHPLKKVNIVLNTNIYSYLETPVANIVKLFTAVITPLAAYFSMILTE